MGRHHQGVLATRLQGQAHPGGGFDLGNRVAHDVVDSGGAVEREAQLVCHGGSEGLKRNQGLIVFESGMQFNY